MPAVLTVIEEVCSPVLHNKVPVAVVDNSEVPQLFTTVTIGAGTTAGCPMVTDPVAAAHPLESVTE